MPILLPSQLWVEILAEPGLVLLELCVCPVGILL